MNKPFSPQWPETVLFWGAGAEVSIGCPTTFQQSQLLLELAGDDKETKTLKERVKKTFPSILFHEEIEDILTVLGDNAKGYHNEISELQVEKVRKLYKYETDKECCEQVWYLRENYDWGSLQKVIRACPGFPNEISLLDLYNILDYHILTRAGFRVPIDENDSLDKYPNGYLILAERLASARNILDQLISVIMLSAYHEALEHRKPILSNYYGFFLELAKLMQEEGVHLSANHETHTREFYTMSYAIINTNWTPYALWFIFNAHKKVNNDSNTPHIGSPATPLKLFHDFGHLMGTRDVDGTDPSIRFPGNEAVVQRLNDPYHVTRRMRMGKFYMPHGSTNWRECPNCGKLTMYLGHEWDEFSKSLFPPTILPSTGKSPYFKVRSGVEEQWPDLLQCAYCGAGVDMKWTTMVMQTAFKGSYPPYLEEIHRDLRVCLENGKHFILMGYSLPPDDTYFRSVLSARVRKQSENGDSPLCSIVNYIGPDLLDQTVEDRWYSGDDFQAIFEELRQKDPCGSQVKTLESVTQIFGKDSVRGYFKGIPDVFLNEGVVNRKRILDLMYPSSHFPENRVHRPSK